jgi:hypothetical protein
MGAGRQGQSAVIAEFTSFRILRFTIWTGNGTHLLYGCSEPSISRSVMVIVPNATPIRIPLIPALTKISEIK